MKKAMIVVAACASQVTAATAADTPLEETLVQGRRESRVIILQDMLELTPDAAALLRKAPGANFNSNGPLSGIAQLRGMFGQRIDTQVNGQTIGSGGPNWMDPPLSYAPAAQLQTLEIFRGIAPVSAGQETIGGAVHASTWKGEFGTSERWDTQGHLLAGVSSVNHGSQINGALVVANQTQKLNVEALAEQANDARSPGGDIHPSEYDRQRLDAGYALQRGAHRAHIDFVHSETGATGTPALPMDIDYFDADLLSAMYHYDTQSIKLEATLYASAIDHGMTNYGLRPAPASPASWRQNIAAADNRGAKLKIAWDTWTLGTDYHAEVHNSDIDNINNPAFYVINFNDARREIAGAFAEYDNQYATGWGAHLGLRVNRVNMDADAVDGTPAQMMPPAAALRDMFNNAERNKTDTNLDAVAKLNKQAGAWNWYLGVAQKTRSPSYQERYLWLPMEATAGLADGRTYTGNVDLEPEISRELELGFDVNGDRFSASPRLFMRNVSDYIQGTESQVSAALMMASMAGALPPLHFNNVEASMQGFDMDFRYLLTEGLHVDGVISYVEGEREDIDDYLYRIAPLNGTFSLNIERAVWGVTLESVLYAHQDKVSSTQSERETAGYGLLNMRGYWAFARGWQLAAGIENALDKFYQSHLTGYNRVNGADIAVGERLPGYGRDLFIRLDYRW